MPTKKTEIYAGRAGVCTTVFFWHCVLCNNDCDGKKYCLTCGVVTPVSI
ncbi:MULTISPECIES: putative zinc ribbon protein [Klebsiella]